jgi:hypothetical protein
MFEKFDKGVSRGCFLAVVVVVLFCSFGALNLWHYLFIDEPMVSAALDCDYDEVKEYLDKGAWPNTRFDVMQSALEAARSCEDGRIVELLKKRGATE